MHTSDHILEAVYSGQLLAFGPVQPKHKLEPSSLQTVSGKSSEYGMHFAPAMGNR